MTLSKKPARQLAVLTCMDCRIDVNAVLDLRLGDAHVFRNAGARVTDDVLRSLALSTGLLGVERLIVMQHTGCGLAGVTDAHVREVTGADIEFLAFHDHAAALREDVDRLVATPFLGSLRSIEGIVYDLDTGAFDTVVRWDREPAPT